MSISRIVFIYKKFDLTLTRRAKAYSSSGSCKVYIQILNSLSGSHNDNNVAAPCEWYRLVSQPEIDKKSTKPLISAFKVIQGHWIRR